MNTEINNNQVVKIILECSDNRKFILSNDQELNMIIYTEMINNNVEFCNLKITDEAFISNDARKIFNNILVNSCDLIPGVLMERNNHQVTSSYRIMISKMNHQEFSNMINIIYLMIDRANNISELITNGVKREEPNYHFLTKYKTLIEGLKTSYEKGLILIKLLFRESGDNGLLSKYYRLIQGKESDHKRREIFYNLLFDESNQTLSLDTKYTRKKQL